MTTQEIIEELKKLINTKGYIYALCMIIFEDFHVNPEKLHEVNEREKLSVNEAALILGFLIQNKINFAIPDSPHDLTQMKKNTFELLEELHRSFIGKFPEKLQKELEKTHKKENYRAGQKEFFGKGDMLVEPIFYSGTGVYDFQYLEFLERKYKYDTKWLSEEKIFNLFETKIIVSQIKDILQKQSEIVFLDLKEIMIGIMKEKNPDEDWEKHVQEIFPKEQMEWLQYEALFYDPEKNEYDWNVFYRNLIELFTIKKADFNSELNIDSFVNNFSIIPEIGLNSQFQTIGNYNMINSHPIIKLDDEKYFVPVAFLLCQAVYESPFYWMIQNESNKEQAGKNRGEVGEEIAFDFLSQVFGADKTFKSVKITSKKGQDDTDIDVLCILGSKAICVQVKSKSLTLLSRQGDDAQLQKDFQGAVQDAYKQGLISRQKILEKGARFIDKKSSNEIILPEGIDDVYLMCVTTENYPTLAHQARVMLEKKDNDPFSIVLTVFDLALLTHYLNDPYDFLYYIRQRTILMDYFVAGEETIFLGYHLEKKLWKMPRASHMIIDTSFGQLIDRNYIPFKLGLKVSDEGDAIKNRWKNENFNRLCNELKNLNEANITDILFYLFDESEEARRNIVNFITSTKQKTLYDGKSHNFSVPPDDSYSERVGFTYFSLNSNDIHELKKELLTLCQLRKYKSKGDVWIGFGSLKDSKNMIDAVVFNDQTWEYDMKLEAAAKIFLRI